METINRCLLGAIIGDICGSPFEGREVKWTDPEDVPLFMVGGMSGAGCTDDTVLTVACYEAASGDRDYKRAYLKYGNALPDAGYGGMFCQWLKSKDPKPYNSYGNGSAMRVSAIGWLFNDEETVLTDAKRSAEPTHNHPEGIKGAQAVALAIFLLRNGISKQELKERIEKDFGYDLSRTLAEIRPTYGFDVTCQGTVPVAITAFLESCDFESAIRNAISMSGDTDTLACITGSLAGVVFDYSDFTEVALQVLANVYFNHCPFGAFGLFESPEIGVFNEHPASPERQREEWRKLAY